MIGNDNNKPLTFTEHSLSQALLKMLGPKIIKISKQPYEVNFIILILQMRNQAKRN